MRKFLLFVSCLFVGDLSLLAGQAALSAKNEVSDKIPRFMVEGFNAYKQGGPDAAMRAWIKGSYLEGSTEALSQANNLRQVQDYYGGYESYALISTRDVTPKTRIICLEIDYEKGPLFSKWVVYHVGQDWSLVNFNFNTKEDVILPGCR